MKRTIIVLIAWVLMVALVGCGNMSTGVGSYRFEKVHVDTHHYSGCLTVVRWYDNGNGVEVETKEVGNIFYPKVLMSLLKKSARFAVTKKENDMTERQRLTDAGSGRLRYELQR